MSTIRAFAAREPGGPLTPYEYDPGPLADDEVEIAVAHCGLCHSDLSMIDDDWESSRYPLVPGHEVVGRVRKRGEAVRRLEVGDRVGLGWHAGYCGACESCDGGDHNLCGSSVATIVGRHGGFADAVRAQARSVVPIPDAIALEDAGPLFCGGITVFNPLVQYGVRPTDRVAVIGIGGLGHLALQFLRAWGCEVTAFSSSADKQDELLALGAHHVVSSREPNALAAQRGRFDFILSTVNVALDWDAYVRALRPRGRLHFVGANPVPLDVSVFPLLAGQRAISASPVGAPTTIVRMLEFAARHHIRPRIEPFPLTEVNRAIDHLRGGHARYRVVLSV